MWSLKSHCKHSSPCDMWSLETYFKRPSTWTDTVFADLIKLCHQAEFNYNELRRQLENLYGGKLEDFQR